MENDFGRAVVFPGQGTAGGEVSGEVGRRVRKVVGDAVVPYQLSVFAGSVDLLYRLKEAGVEANVVAGHSLGEYAAAHAAGCLGLEEAMRLVAERDRLMNEASRKNPGGMVAVIGADPKEVARAVEKAEGLVVAANFNTPRQTVISGKKEALEEVSREVKGRKVPLKVAGAFHSPLMREASEKMGRLLSEVDFGEPEVPMIGAAGGNLLRTAREVRAALEEQMLLPVRWVSVVRKFEEVGVREVVEAGEDGTLSRMFRDFKSKTFEVKTAGEVLG